MTTECDLIYGKYINKARREQLHAAVNLYRASKRLVRSADVSPPVKKIQDRIQELKKRIESGEGKQKDADWIERLKKAITEEESKIGDIKADLDKDVEETIQNILKEDKGDLIPLMRLEASWIARKAELSTDKISRARKNHIDSNFSEEGGHVAPGDAETGARIHLNEFWAPHREYLKNWGAQSLGSGVSRLRKKLSGGLQKDSNLIATKDAKIKAAYAALRRQLNPDDASTAPLVLTRSLRGILDDSSQDALSEIQSLGNSGLRVIGEKESTGEAIYNAIRRVQENVREDDFGVSEFAELNKVLEIADAEKYAEYIRRGFNGTGGDSTGQRFVSWISNQKYAAVLETMAQKISKRNAIRDKFGMSNMESVQEALERIYGSDAKGDIDAAIKQYYGRDLPNTDGAVETFAVNSLHAFKKIMTLDTFAHTLIPTLMDPGLSKGDILIQYGRSGLLKRDVKQAMKKMTPDQKKALTRLIVINDTAQGSSGLSSRQAQGYEDGVSSVNRIVNDWRDFNQGRQVGEFFNNRSKLHGHLVISQLFDEIRKFGFDGLDKQAVNTLRQSGIPLKELKSIVDNDAVWNEVAGMRVLDLNAIGKMDRNYQAYFGRLMAIGSNRSSGYATQSSARLLGARFIKHPLGQAALQLFTQGHTHPYRAWWELGGIAVNSVREGTFNKYVASGIGIQAAVGATIGSLRAQINEEIRGEEYTNGQFFLLVAAYGTPFGWLADIVTLGPRAYVFGSLAFEATASSVGSANRAWKNLGDGELKLEDMRSIPFINAITAPFILAWGAGSATVDAAEETYDFVTD